MITPVRSELPDQEILAVVRDGRQQVILAATPDTTVEGVYGFFFDGGRGMPGSAGSFLLAGERHRPAGGGAVYAGDLDTPAAAGGAVRLPGSGRRRARQRGRADRRSTAATPRPGWSPPRRPPTWAIMVHGRGANRRKALRALRPAHELGLTSLLVSYRNDGLAPSAATAATGSASPNGATWRPRSTTRWPTAPRTSCSSAGPWAARSACRSPTSRAPHRMQALVLDAPVINWIDVLAHQARSTGSPNWRAASGS